jgi:hypothetical protein
MRFGEAIRARKARTVFFYENRPAFLALLREEIRTLVRSAERKHMIPMVRLNGTSDIPWEHQGIMEDFPDVQFYDYTKSIDRMRAFLDGRMPKNYHLTFSRSEINEETAHEILDRRGTVAVVFSHPPFPESWHGYPVIDGDQSDIRPWDATGAVVGLKAKGEARGKQSAFIVELPVLVS